MYLLDEHNPPHFHAEYAEFRAIISIKESGVIKVKMKTVIQVIPRNDFKVYVFFNDGKIKLYDMSPLVNNGVFKQISNIVVFKETCTVLNHTLAWDLLGNRDEYNCLDIDPESIYMNGIDVEDPTKITA